jgi:predicted Zn-dependent protease
MDGLLGHDEALSRLESALAGSPADATELVLLGDSTSVTRYANSGIHQNVEQTSQRIAVRVTVGKATARVFTGSLAQEDLRTAIEQATILARLQAPDPRWTPLPSQATGYPPPTAFSQCWFDSTANLPPGARAESVGVIIDAAARAGFQAFGTFRSSAEELAVVSTMGIRSYAAYTTAYLKALVEGPQGTGFSDSFSRDAAELDPVRVAEEAVAKCRANHDQATIEPGDYEAIFDPNAVADMLRFPAVWGMGARQTLDGQSFLSGRIGEPVAGPQVSIWDDPTDPRCLPTPIDYEGLPSTQVDIITRGIAQGPVYDSRTAQEAGVRSTGHASNPFSGFGGGPTADHIVMQVGDASMSAMISHVRQGVLVTRFHYTHCPDGKRVIATGTTRDGTFLIRDGEIKGALKNLRLEMGVLDLLSSLQETGEGKSCQDWWAANGMATQQYFVPTMRFDKCTFTGVTTF